MENEYEAVIERCMALMVEVDAPAGAYRQGLAELIEEARTRIAASLEAEAVEERT